MNYWPLSVILHSPFLSATYAYELSVVHKTYWLSQHAFTASIDVALHTQPVPAPNLVIIESVGAPPRQMYKEYPTDEEWDRLEQSAVIQGSNGGFHVIIEARH